MNVKKVSARNAKAAWAAVRISTVGSGIDGSGDLLGQYFPCGYSTPLDWVGCFLLILRLAVGATPTVSEFYTGTHFPLRQVSLHN